jgi:hypothetical protein
VIREKAFQIGFAPRFPFLCVLGFLGVLRVKSFPGKIINAEVTETTENAAPPLKEPSHIKVSLQEFARRSWPCYLPQSIGEKTCPSTK